MPQIFRKSTIDNKPGFNAIELNMLEKSHSEPNKYTADVQFSAEAFSIPTYKKWYPTTNMRTNSKAN